MIPHSTYLDTVGDMVLSPYAKQKVIALHTEEFKALSISKKLWEEGICITQVKMHKFLCVYKATYSTQQRSGSGCSNKYTAE